MFWLPETNLLFLPATISGILIQLEICHLLLEYILKCDIIKMKFLKLWDCQDILK